MSDLRNHYGSDLSDIKIVEPVEHVEPTIYTRSIPEMDIGDRPESLGAFHTVDVEDTSSTGRIVGGLAIALMLGAAAVYGYEVSTSSQAAKPVVTQTAANNPAPAPAMMAPRAQSADATQTAPLPSEAAPTPVAPSEAAPAAAPVKKAPARAARSVASSASSANSVSSESSAPASSTGVPEQSAAVQPVYPTAPASSLANNNNQPVVTPDMPETAPAIPDVAPAQPAPDAAPVEPTPDQAVQPAPDQSAQPAQ